GALLTTSTQLWLDVRPAGTFMLREGGSGQGEAVTTATPVVSAAPHASAAKAKASEVQPSDNVDGQEPESPGARPSVIMSRSSVAVVTWGIIALSLGLGYIARRLILVGRLGDRRAVPDGKVVDVLTELARDAGLRRTPRLTSTSQISSPVALGIGEICVPDTALTDLDLEQQRSLLAHELAHLARRDPVWLVAGSLIERVFWIQPLNRIANREIATSAEFL